MDDRFFGAKSSFVYLFVITPPSSVSSHGGPQRILQALVTNPMPRECHVSFGRGSAATRWARSQAMCLLTVGGLAGMTRCARRGPSYRKTERRLGVVTSAYVERIAIEPDRAAFPASSHLPEQSPLQILATQPWTQPSTRICSTA